MYGITKLQGYNFSYARWVSFKDLIYNIMSIDNNSVSNTEKSVKRVNTSAVTIIKNKIP